MSIRSAIVLGRALGFVGAVLAFLVAFVSVTLFVAVIGILVGGKAGTIVGRWVRYWISLHMVRRYAKLPDPVIQDNEPPAPQWKPRSQPGFVLTPPRIGD